MSHLFFEPEMGLSAHFQQKRPKRPKKIFQRAGGKIHFLSRDIFFFGLFWPFFAENGQEGLKDPFLVQKVGGTFFLGGVKKHELGVGNYR